MLLRKLPHWIDSASKGRILLVFANEAALPNAKGGLFGSTIATGQG